MNKVAVLSDTVTEMTRELADEYNIRIAPINIVMDGKQYPENEIDPDWYRKQIPEWGKADKIPTSSAISVGYFPDAYRELSRQAKQLVERGLE